MMSTDKLSYHLPKDRIAITPAEPREDAKLLCYSRKEESLFHKTVRDLPSLITPNDVVVLNTASVMRARFFGRTKSNQKREILLLRETRSRRGISVWEALIGGKVRPGDRIMLPDGVLVKVQYQLRSGSWQIQFHLPQDRLRQYINDKGHVPIPPYIDREVEQAEYETAYADTKERRSAAAPTAGFHLTLPLLQEIENKGAVVERLVLDVGWGTFQPIRTKRLEDHSMHAERVKISHDTANRITNAKKEGKRIIAVGTTTVRALESAADRTGKIHPFDGETSLFITPGYEFRVVEGLLTNFHLPRSSLLALVSAFIGSTETTLELYQEALENEYRFYSFGDAMFIM